MGFSENDLVKLIRIEADEINAAFDKASIEGRGTPQEVSDRRELALTLFLQKFYPFPYRIVKGNILDSFDTRSASIDAIVLNPIHPLTTKVGTDKCSLIIADGVDAAIELKPNLIGNELDRSLEQGLTVKTLKRRESPYLLHSNYSQEQLDNSKLIPFFIFSINSYSNIEDLITRIVGFYVEKQTPPEKQFDFICVNKKFLIINYRKNYFFTHAQGFEGIAIAHYKEDTLAAFLLWLNRLHGAQAGISTPILQHYLIDSLSNLQCFNTLNAKLKMIGKK